MKIQHRYVSRAYPYPFSWGMNVSVARAFVLHMQGNLGDHLDVVCTGD